MVECPVLLPRLTDRRPALGSVIRAAHTVLHALRLSRFNRTSQFVKDPGKIVRMNKICDGPTLQFFKRPTRILHQLLIDELDVPIGRRTENKAGNQIEIVRRDSCLSAQVGKCV